MGEWRNGLPVLVTAMVAIYWMNLLTYPTGVLIKPIEAEWGWSRGETTLLVSFSTLVTLTVGSYAGSVAGRIGVYRTALFGFLAMALGLLFIGLSGPNLLLWYAAWTWFAVSQQFCTVIVWSYAITLSFARQRGLALSLAMVGSAIAASTFPPLTLYLHGMFGLRGAYIGLGVLVLVTMLPLMAITHRKYRPVTETPASGGSAAEAWGLSLPEALRSRRFWGMGLGMMMAAGVTSAVVFHYHSLMTDRGMSVKEATWVMTLIGPALFVGRIGTGWLLDRWSARAVVITIFAFPIVACAILATFSGSLPLAIAAALFVGLAAGAEGDMLAYFVSRYFGVRHYGAIYGLQLGLFGIGFGSFPPAIGFLYDMIGSYAAAFAVSGVLLTAGAAFLALLGRYPDPPAPQP